MAGPNTNRLGSYIGATTAALSRDGEGTYRSVFAAGRSRKCGTTVSRTRTGIKNRKQRYRRRADVLNRYNGQAHVVSTCHECTVVLDSELHHSHTD